MNEDLKPCPFCGGMPNIYGQEIRDYVNGEWAKATRKEYWIQPFCYPSCHYGNIHASRYGVVGGQRYISPDAAVRAWNKGRDNE